MIPMAPVYYNDNDPHACAWLRNLCAAGAIPPGVVDERSITTITATDLVGFTHVNLFAGIAGWSEALRLAGWPDDRPCFRLIPCRDGKARRISAQPGDEPLAPGLPSKLVFVRSEEEEETPSRVGLLRGYGNSIVPQVAAIFIRAFLDSEGKPE